MTGETPKHGGVTWPQVALAVVSGLLTLGTAWLAGHTSSSATSAQRAVIVTQEMLDRARARAEHIEERLTVLEEKIERDEAVEKALRERGEAGR